MSERGFSNVAAIETHRAARAKAGLAALRAEKIARIPITEKKLLVEGTDGLISPLLPNLTVRAGWESALERSQHFAWLEVPLGPSVALLPSFSEEVCRHLRGRRPLCNDEGHALVISFDVMDSSVDARRHARYFADAVQLLTAGVLDTSNRSRVDIRQTGDFF